MPHAMRFGGWWALVWLNTLRCIQLRRGESSAVGRSIALQDEADPGARLATLREATLFVTTRDESLPEALEAGVPTILVRDGDARFDETPPIAARFDDDKLQVLHAQSGARRNLTLERLQAALERFAPGSCRRDGGESRQCSARLDPYLRGTIADLGHGACKIRPHAVGVDVFRFDERDWIGDVRDMHFFADASFDSVYSSHCLEDLWDPHQALDEWMRILRPGGHLSLYLPMRGFYPSVGTPGANPGHKDDYVPEDVEAFLRDVGGNEIVRSERFEDELSFEIVTRRTASTSLALTRREALPPPELSVLIVGQAGVEPSTEAYALQATLASAQSAITQKDAEFLVLLRDIPDHEQLAALRDFAVRDPRIRIVEDLRPLPYAERVALLAEHARAPRSIVLASGSVCMRESLDALCASGEHDKAVYCPRVVDVQGRALPRARALATCVALPTRVLRSEGFAQSPYKTPAIYEALAREATHDVFQGGLVIGDGLASFAGRSLGRHRFDMDLLAAGVRFDEQGASRVLVVMLRTMGDAILATTSVRALAERWPDAEVEVLTERGNAWVFEGLPGVRRVLTCEPATDLAREEAAIEAALAESRPDRLAMLCTRSDSAPYNAAGDLRLAEYYAIQAGAPDAGRDAPELQLPQKTHDDAARVLAALGVSGPYAAIHTRAGWASKSPSPEQCEAIVEAFAAEGLPVVVVGGPGELVPHHRALNLAGMIPPETSAAVIAGAAAYAGPDSGCLHVASAFGVPALALYAASHPRIAPPLGACSESLLASTSCERPCGTLCFGSACGMTGIARGDLRDAVARLMERARGAEGTDTHPCLLRGDAVAWIPGPRGSQRPLGANPAPALREETRGTPRRRPVASTRAARCELELSDGTLQSAVRGARVARCDDGPRLHTTTPLAYTLDGMRRRDRMSTCIALGKLGVVCEDPSLALAHVLRAARIVQDCVDGSNGRARPAFDAYLDALFAFAVTVPARRGDFVPLERALAFWSEHITKAPNTIHVLTALTERELEDTPHASRALLLRALARVEHQELDTVHLRNYARALLELGAEAEADAALEERLRVVVSPGTRASLLWDRVPWLLRCPERFAELGEVLSFVAAESKSASARSLAKRLLAQLSQGSPSAQETESGAPR